MKRYRNIAALCILALALAGIASAAAYVAYTVQAYDGVCEKLEGFPGFLQGAGLLATGNCSSLPLRKCLSQPCTLGGKPGKCLPRVVGGKKHCICVIKTISK